jgi:hypothetical protein
MHPGLGAATFSTPFPPNAKGKGGAPQVGAATEEPGDSRGGNGQDRGGDFVDSDRWDEFGSAQLQGGGDRDRFSEGGEHLSAVEIFLREQHALRSNLRLAHLKEESD